MQQNNKLTRLYEQCMYLTPLGGVLRNKAEESLPCGDVNMLYLRLTVSTDKPFHHLLSSEHPPSRHFAKNTKPLKPCAHYSKPEKHLEENQRHQAVTLQFKVRMLCFYQNAKPQCVKHEQIQLTVILLINNGFANCSRVHLVIAFI